MSSLTATRKHSKSKQKKSGFQKLWDKADRLQRQNEQLKSRLDGLIERTEQTIKPVEKEAAESDIPLLRKLLKMGQRKSLAKWEREVLDEWIKDMITEMQVFGITDSEMMDDVARYDAYRLGIELDEDPDGASGTAYEQLSDHIQNLQRETEEAAERERAETEADFDNLKETMEAFVESILDERLGPPPATDRPESGTPDIFQSELDAELEKQAEDYQARRQALRDEIMNELNQDLKDEFGASPFDDGIENEEDPFTNPDFGFEDEHQTTSTDAPKIDNQTFHKMFRATAAKLHPDRESDPARRLEKQKLMADLLKARKKGDLLTVFRMYQQHTNNSESFSKADEAQLTQALRQHIEQLEKEKDEIILQSPMHYSVYHSFYHTSKKKQDQKIEQHLKRVRKKISESSKCFSTIKSLKTLKPWLEVRYDNLRFSALEGLMGGIDLGDMDWDNDPF